MEQTIPPINMPRLRGAGFLFLVEDDTATREAVTEFLTGRGLQVEAYSDCETFLEQYRTTRTGYLLLDYHFNGMDAFQLLDTLRTRGITLPTLLYTGRFNGDLRRRAAGYPEVIAFLEKPLGGQSLLDALRDAVRSGDAAP